MKLASKELVHKGYTSLLARKLEVTRMSTPIGSWNYFVQTVPTVRWLMWQYLRKYVYDKKN